MSEKENGQRVAFQTDKPDQFGHLNVGAPSVPIEYTRVHTNDNAESHANKLLQWESVQSQVLMAMKVPFAGMIADADVYESFYAHRSHLELAGYNFGKYAYDRSMFERLDREVFQLTPPEAMGKAVFHEVKSMLEQINQEANPTRGKVIDLVFTQTAYVLPMAKLVHLLTHPLAIADDIDLFWEITDRLWCACHPIYHLHSARLDYTCSKIIKRVSDLESAATTKMDIGTQVTNRRNKRKHPYTITSNHVQ